MAGNEVDPKYLSETEAELNSFLNGTDTNKKGAMSLKPPAPGEVMYCHYCGKPMLPKDFSEDKFQRKYEWKWHIHWRCQMEKEALADRSTPGLSSERKRYDY